MKVLFLDIDGVLNRFGDEDGNGRTTKLIDDFFIGLDTAPLQIYKAMLSRISVTVVLSSTWRHWQPMLDHLKENGVEFSHMTPSLRDPHLGRGHEIQAWLMEHPEVTKYAILDDDTGMLEHQLPNFFQAMTETGITQELADRIVAHLTDGSSASLTKDFV